MKLAGSSDVGFDAERTRHGMHQFKVPRAYLMLRFRFVGRKIGKPFRFPRVITIDGSVAVDAFNRREDFCIAARTGISLEKHMDKRLVRLVHIIVEEVAVDIHSFVEIAFGFYHIFRCDGFPISHPGVKAQQHVELGRNHVIDQKPLLDKLLICPLHKIKQLQMPADKPAKYGHRKWRQHADEQLNNFQRIPGIGDWYCRH